jgi:hypothetical protein
LRSSPSSLAAVGSRDATPPQGVQREARLALHQDTDEGQLDRLSEHRVVPRVLGVTPAPACWFNEFLPPIRLRTVCGLGYVARPDTPPVPCPILAGTRTRSASPLGSHPHRLLAMSLSIPTSTALSVRSSSQSIRSSANERDCGQLQNSPIRSARSRSGSMTTRSSSARGAGPSASRRAWGCRSSWSGPHCLGLRRPMYGRVTGVTRPFPR